jgi:hypothetical protein
LVGLNFIAHAHTKKSTTILLKWWKGNEPLAWHACKVLSNNHLLVIYLHFSEMRSMKKLRVEGKRIDDLIKFLSSSNPDDEDVCKASIIKEIGDRKIGFFVIEGLYMRIQHTVTCSVFFYQTDLNSCEIIAVGSGGASALGITWGAQKDIEKKIAEHILKFAEEAGMKGQYIS